MLDWHTIETVLLDMDGTLLDLHFDNFFWNTHLPKRLAQLKDQDPNHIQQQMRQRFRDEYGSLNWYSTQYWAEQLQVDIVKLKHEVTDKIALRNSVIEFLQALQQSDKRVILVTNAHQESLDINMNIIDLRPYFDQIVISHDLEHPKEAQLFWHRFQESTPFNPNTSLLIDDNENVLSAAKQYGVKYLLAPKQPDSTQASRETLKHPSFHDYSELLPVL